MGCGLVKTSKKNQNIMKNVEIDNEPAMRENKFSLYTVKEELSEMEQSRNASNRQSVLVATDIKDKIAGVNGSNRLSESNAVDSNVKPSLGNELKV